MATTPDAAKHDRSGDQLTHTGKPANRKAGAGKQLPSAPWLTRALLWAILVGLALVVANAFWVCVMEAIIATAWGSLFPLPPNVLFLFLALVLLNAAVRRRWPRFALSGAGLAIIYGMMAMTTAAIGDGTHCYWLLGWMSVPGWYATPQNRWDRLFLGHLPDWLVVTDKRVLAGFFEGDSSLYGSPVWQQWATRVAFFLLWVLLVFGLYLSLNLILRRRWTDEEHLPFPIVELPTALIQQGASLLRTRLFWITFAAVSVIQLCNGLNFLFPSFPRLTPGTVPLMQYLPRPWNASNASLVLAPFVMGMIMLMPLDLSFSCWAFYWFQQAELIITRALAWDVVPDFPHIREQSAAAFLAIVAYSLYTGRNYFLAVLRRALGLRSSLDDSAEAIGYRWAILIFVASFIGLVLYSRALGMSTGLAIGFLCIFAALSLALTRMRAQLGPPIMELYAVGPEMMLTQVMGPASFRPRALVAMMLYRWCNWDYSAHFMPHQLEAMKLADAVGAPRRLLVLALLLALPVAVVAWFWLFLTSAYRLGAGSAKISHWLVTGVVGQAGVLTTWLTAPLRPAPFIPWSMGTAFLLSIGLLALRTRFPGLPLHPMGYAMASVWSVSYVWTDFLIVWLVKLLIVRYHGLKGYRQAMTVAFAMILADVVMGAFWAFFGMVKHAATYQVWGWSY